jgi:hypothetical protein
MLAVELVQLLGARSVQGIDQSLARQRGLHVAIVSKSLGRGNIAA